ncbi:uracil-DNA glycosylase [Halobacillus halophilus]|uniref:Uracil-DNA glycosylase n=1 Tax=Halobacillus halophilus (strain ATCC 35676 / DSM 2266 / JCM 20832 / KCTC 3685 / LMG 17431 / NBRC 102448 / NCIMB 2269) TaxID=866895 RepID=I0JN37_HALH3|nr:uracil-DNA glycosylase [Halobacillus halophilus]ASF39624.1 uracil-DNA glycosylase [Halobacillus halophilus]CCG45557.1 uracil-DNA glycosylase [Halobacillus halophilus DSM 2266]
MKVLDNDWGNLLEEEFHKPYYLDLREKLKKEYGSYNVYPDMYEIFSAMQYTSYENTKVVILGQDPYHGPEQAHGFSFSVKPGVTIPPSLKNIYKELREDLGIEPPSHGHLVSWAKEGVLLLNNVLTVRAHQAHSHQGMGWERFTDEVIRMLNQREKPIVFILWGKHAQKKGKSIDRSKHKVLTAPHPSPLAAHRGFFGSRPFSQANQYLEEIGEEPINWALPANPENS